MPTPIRFWFDFASPYAYLCAPRLERLAARHGRAVEWRPTLLWAVFKAQGIPAPMESPARRAYMLADMERSAAFHGRPLATPLRLPFSAHLAGRLFYGLQAAEPQAAPALARALLEARFARGEDIAALDGLQATVAALGHDPAMAEFWIDVGRALLARAVDEAVADGVVGSPYMILDGEGFFGADRLPQLEWRLAQGRPIGATT